MIRESRTPAREFDVIGYAEFEELYENENKWIKRVERVFVNVDFEHSCNDYRPQQLKDILAASAKLVLEINSLVINSKLFTQESIQHVSDYLNSKVSEQN